VDWKCVTNGLECVLCVWAFASPIGMYMFERILCYVRLSFCLVERLSVFCVTGWSVRFVL